MSRRVQILEAIIDANVLSSTLVHDLRVDQPGHGLQPLQELRQLDMEMGSLRARQYLIALGLRSE